MKILMSNEEKYLKPLREICEGSPKLARLVGELAGYFFNQIDDPRTAIEGAIEEMKKVIELFASRSAASLEYS